MGQPEINDSFIKELYIQDHELEFLMEDSDRIYYSCQDCESSSIVLHGLPQEEGGFQCEGDLGEQPVKRGVNTFSVRITKEGTVVREYMISVVVKASPADVSIKVILVNDDEAVIAEDGEYYYYQVGQDCTQAEVEAIPSDSKAEVEGDLGLIDLETGMNFLLIRIYSADRSNKASYQLAIERREAGEEKETAKVWQAEINDEGEPSAEVLFEVGLHPEEVTERADEQQQDAGETDRNLETDFEALAARPDYSEEENQAEAAPEAGDSEENGEADQDTGESEENGEADQVTGGGEENGEADQVTGDSGDTGNLEYGEDAGNPEYGEDIIGWDEEEDMAELAAESRLSDLKVEGCRLKPEFSPDIFDYKVDFQGEISEILVEAIPMDLSSVLEGDLGLQVVVTGYNAFSVLCTAPDGITKSLYKYSVEKKKAEETNVSKKSSQELKDKKRDYKRKVWKARLLKFQSFVSSKTQKKSTMSQSQKMTVLLLLLLCANYPIYIYMTKPATQRRTALETESAQVSNRRREVEGRISNKEKTVKNIEDDKVRLQEIGNKYPHFPSQEEILYYLDDLQKKVPVTYTAAFIGEPAAVQTSDILNDIAAKNIGTVMGNLDSLTPPGSQTATSSNAAVAPDTGDGQALAEPPGQFRKNILAVTLQGSKPNVLQAYDDFIQDQRLIITDEIQLTNSGDQNTDSASPSGDVWNLSFNAYYYQYTGLAERSYHK